MYDMGDVFRVVLSHNNFNSIDISSLSQLTKLSLSHNHLTSVPNTKVHFIIVEYIQINPSFKLKIALNDPGGFNFFIMP